MAVKFSQFNVETDVANVGYLVGYDGTDNVQITPANLIASSSIIDGSGTAEKIPKWVDAETLTDSIMTEDPTGPTISVAGNIDLTGTLTGTTATFVKDQNADSIIQLYNANAGAAAQATIYVGNSSAAADGLFLGANGTGMTTAGGFVQDGAAIGSGTGASGGLSIMTRATADMRFYTNGHTNERMRITSAGNVLVGATNSDIGGSVTGVKFTQDGMILASDDATGDTSSVLYLDRRGTNNEGKVLMFGMGGFLKAGIGVIGTSANTNDGGITFETIGTNPATYDERMRITQAGNVGIGTASPHNDVSGLSIAVAGSTDQLYLERTGSGTGRYYLGTASNSFYIVDDVAASTRAIIDSSGNVGIGTTSPTSGMRLDVHGGDFRVGDDANQGLEGGYSSGAGVAYLQGYNRGTSAFIDLLLNNNVTITSAGNVGIGTTSPSNKFVIKEGTNVDVEFGSEASGGFIQTYNRTSSAWGYLRFITSGAETMRLNSSGDIIFGTTSLGTTHAYFESSSNSRMVLSLGSSTTSSSVVGAFKNPNGTVGTISTNGSATAYNTSSDYRLKENVVEMTGALDRVNQLKPSRFNFISDADKTLDGFLAHEVQDIVPEAITGEKDATDNDGNPQYQGIDQSKLVPLLVGAIQELKAEIDELKNK